MRPGTPARSILAVRGEPRRHPTPSPRTRGPGHSENRRGAISGDRGVGLRFMAAAGQKSETTEDGTRKTGRSAARDRATNRSNYSILFGIVNGGMRIFRAGGCGGLPGGVLRSPRSTCRWPRRPGLLIPEGVTRNQSALLAEAARRRPLVDSQARKAGVHAPRLTASLCNAISPLKNSTCPSKSGLGDSARGGRTLPKRHIQRAAMVRLQAFRLCSPGPLPQAVPHRATQPWSDSRGSLPIRSIR